uniref:Transmembrane protein n=1 Tax=Macrostomum lignano TaxID=282301 RepID=A0A1I8FQA1_9PLAT
LDRFVHRCDCRLRRTLYTEDYCQRERVFFTAFAPASTQQQRARSSDDYFGRLEKESMACCFVSSLCLFEANSAYSGTDDLTLRGRSWREMRQLMRTSIRFVSHSWLSGAAHRLWARRALGAKERDSAREGIGSPADYLHRLLAFYSSPLVRFVYTTTRLPFLHPLVFAWPAAVQLLRTFGKLCVNTNPFLATCQACGTLLTVTSIGIFIIGALVFYHSLFGATVSALCSPVHTEAALLLLIDNMRRFLQDLFRASASIADR